MRRSGAGPSGGGGAGGGGGAPPTSVSERRPTSTVSPSAVGHASASASNRVSLKVVVSPSRRSKDCPAMQRVLVTGGCGYLGRELLARASGRGWRPRATWFERPPPASGTWRRVDVRDAAAVAEAVRDVGAVVHTAYRQGEGEWEVNALGSEVVARAAVGRRLVHVSSDLVFAGDRG